MMLEKNRVLSVSELNRAAREWLESGFPLCWVRGEISNFVRAASGHWYFSLKDEQAQVRCVMFRHKSQYLDWQPKNGMQVETLALTTLYEARGDFQLTLEQMRPAGLGSLHEAFERLKKKLEAEGLFDAARKRDLPFMPAQIGIVTSLQAAALRDVLTTLQRRMPAIPVVVYPAPVQGEDAARKIAQAIETANARAECDVLIVCRGGGGIEDLWAFNEEIVARALAASVIPVASGIGHETDFTIADFAADQRAATPTAAAQLATPDRNELSSRLDHLAQRLRRGHQRIVDQATQRLDFLQRRLVHPAQKIRQQKAQLDGWQQRLRRARPDLARLSMQQAEWLRRLREAARHMLETRHVRLENMRQNLTHLDPRQVLARGYSLVRDERGAVVTDGATLSVGAKLDIAFAQGWARAGVEANGGGAPPSVPADE